MQKQLEEIANRLEKTVERLNFEEYIRYSVSWKKQLAVNFVGGLARGVGMAVGFTLLGAMIIALLSKLLTLNIPIFGDYLAEVIRIVLERL